ncbi:proline-rich antigen 3 [Coccidioides immitis RS]|uniref:Proline-rich antigen 3 n=4 Tax=Coccidioides immitis TaxID=5501 RepID=J3KLH8_COCIM|nr:proline-rich antigen 3 [Coccidioides immitis RS]EAS37138.3 proline-rich antigen 3 [Coccidioides immitis RS]KMU80112.1 hypothetical protein CISG_08454 [Coccidioides immitis RMSCC 3703]KMU86594.1 hypothetical protein CIHG_04382 [Coccidioides immitis H538.4]TPX24850.1 hypothetical protein DIZ76_010294 [Coccidioides immitis]
MHFTTSLALFGTLVAASQAVEPIRGSYESNEVLSVLKRQTVICKPVPAPFTCERSCGPGFVQCVYPSMCYNPGRGDSCCANGKYCRKGTYCTDRGCCLDGLSLEECGATRTISVIPPPDTQPSTEAPSPTDEPSETEPAPTETETEEPEPTETEVEPTPTEEPTTPTIIPTGTGNPGYPGNNATFTSPSPPQQTVNAAAQIKGAAMALGLGVVGVVVALM